MTVDHAFDLILALAALITLYQLSQKYLLGR
jgi:hypothetical protein